MAIWQEMTLHVKGNKLYKKLSESKLVPREGKCKPTCYKSPLKSIHLIIITLRSGTISHSDRFKFTLFKGDDIKRTHLIIQINMNISLYTALRTT